MKTFKIKPKFEYEAIQYKYSNAKESLNNIEELFKEKGIEILKTETDSDYQYPDKNWEMYLFVKLSNWELDIVTIKDSWYIWVDEIGLVNSCSPEYFEENYELV